MVVNKKPFPDEVIKNDQAHDYSLFTFVRLFDKGILRIANKSIIKVLDVGCGSENNGCNYSFGKYPPIFCRLLHAHGFNVVGVDIVEQGEEHFPYRVMDVTLPEKLRSFGKTEFTVVRDSRFTGESLSFDPYLKKQLEKSGEGINGFLEAFRSDVTYILQEGGIYIRESTSRDEYFIKTSGELVPIEL